MTPSPTAAAVYKVMRQAELAALIGDGATTGSPDDRRDGFVHLSTAAQVADTLARHFCGKTSLWLVEVVAPTDGLRFEPSRGGSLFPHLYRPLRVDDVVAIVPIPDLDRDAWCDEMPRFTLPRRAP